MTDANEGVLNKGVSIPSRLADDRVGIEHSSWRARVGVIGRSFMSSGGSSDKGAEMETKSGCHILMLLEVAEAEKKGNPEAVKEGSKSRDAGTSEGGLSRIKLSSGERGASIVILVS